MSSLRRKILLGVFLSNFFFGSFQVGMAEESGDSRSVAQVKRAEADDEEKEQTAKKQKLSSSEDEKKRSHSPETSFPTTLEGFKYHFNADGQLRHIETDERFEFEVRKDDPKYNQKRYEALGEVITEYVYDLLETEVGLKRITVPVDASQDEAKGFIFATKSIFKETDKVLVLIHGDGVVRAGQWARRLIINDCLDSGTQLPFIKRAKQMGYELLVLNSNLNKAVAADGREELVRGSSTSKQHVIYVWDHFLAKSPVESVAFVAHSYGGVSTLNLALKREESFCRKVFFVAFTDSVHQMSFQNAPDSIRNWFFKNSVNWVKSDKPLDTRLSESNKDSPKLSAGTTKHEETSWKSFNSVFKSLSQRYEKKMLKWSTSKEREEL